MGEGIDAYPDIKYDVLSEVVADHCSFPLIVRFEQQHYAKRPQFKYFKMWASCPQVLDIVREIWKQPVQGTPMFELTRKLKSIKLPLKALNKSQSIQVRLLEALATSSDSVGHPW